MDTKSFEIVEASVAALREQIARIYAMWRDPFVQMYQDKDIPDDGRDMMFLEGPTSRTQHIGHNYRSQQVKWVREAGYDGWIFVPETRGLEAFYKEVGDSHDFTEKKYVHFWESSRIKKSRIISVWLPRDSGDQLGLNTNLELGIEIGKIMAAGRQPDRHVFAGYPPGAERMGLPQHYMEGIELEPYSDLKIMCFRMAQA